MALIVKQKIDINVPRRNIALQGTGSEFNYKFLKQGYQYH